MLIIFIIGGVISYILLNRYPERHFEKHDQFLNAPLAKNQRLPQSSTLDILANKKTMPMPINLSQEQLIEEQIAKKIDANNVSKKDANNYTLNKNDNKTSVVDKNNQSTIITTIQNTTQKNSNKNITKNSTNDLKNTLM